MINLQPIFDANELALSNQLKELERSYKQLSESNKRRITIPAIFNRSGDENFISDYLAYILDPERNGVGIEPLQVMLALAYEDISEIDLSDVTIIREYTFSKHPGYGRIDFVIELGNNGENGVIGIENKIYSSEGDNQTTAYVRGLRGDYEDSDLYLIFLTPTGIKAQAGEFRAVSYREYSKALRQQQFPVLKDIHKTVIWEDFIYHLEEYIVMSNGKLELSGNGLLYLEHHQMIEELNRAFQDDSQKVYDYVTSYIKNYFGEGWHFHFQGRNGYQEINKDPWKMDKYYVYCQFIFSRESLLTGDSFAYMIGLWPKNPGSLAFYEWLKANKPQIPEICGQYNLDCFPTRVRGTGGHVVANKEYPLVFDPETIENYQEQLIQALEEFADLIPVMDDAVEEYKRIVR